MKIAIDISQIVHEGTGVANYTRNLVRELLKINHQSKKHAYILFGASLRKKSSLEIFARDLRRDGLQFKESFWLLPPSFTSRIWNQVHHVRIEKLIGKIDLFHSSDWSEPPTNAKKVTTIHDLVIFKSPESSKKETIENQTKKLHWVKKEADAIIAVSKNTKKDILENLEIPSSKIHVIYEGVGEQFQNFRTSEKPGKKYILAMAGVGNRKNTQRTKEAFTLLNKKNLTLDIIGENLGFIKDEDLPGLYAGAELFAYPSLYEGFGLPVLEAMSVGCPVVTSNKGSLPEIAGDAAVFVNPTNVENIMQGFKEVLTWSPSKRRQMIAKGRLQSAKFTWQKAARETLNLYESLV